MEPTVKYPFFKMITLIPHLFGREEKMMKSIKKTLRNKMVLFVPKKVRETVGGGQF